MKKFYKGFNEDLTCRGFQFEEGKTYTEDKADLCNCGFHACEDPLDCFNYYAPSSSQFREVLLDGISPQRQNDSKVCAKVITIGARLSFSELVKAAFEFRWSKTTLEPGASATGKEGIAAALGKKSKAKAELGGWIILAERGEWDGGGFPIMDIKAFQVDGCNIQPNTWYSLIDGKLVKIE